MIAIIALNIHNKLISTNKNSKICKTNLKSKESYFKTKMVFKNKNTEKYLDQIQETSSR